MPEETNIPPKSAGSTSPPKKKNVKSETVRLSIPDKPKKAGSSASSHTVRLPAATSAKAGSAGKPGSPPQSASSTSSAAGIASARSPRRPATAKPAPKSTPPVAPASKTSFRQKLREMSGVHWMAIAVVVITVGLLGSLIWTGITVK